MVARCCSSSTSATPRPTSARSAGERAARALALRDRAPVDRRRARRRAAQPARAARLRLRATSTPRSSPRPCPSSSPSGRRWPRAISATRCSRSGPGTKTGMAIRYDNPREIGADRLVNAVAIRERFGGPAVCVDFGTATTFDVVSARGRVPRRLADDRHRDLARSALRTRRAAAEGRPRAAAQRDRQEHDRRDPLGRRVRLRRRDRRDPAPPLRRARRAHRRGRHRRPGAAGRALHRGDRGGRRPADAHRPAPAARAQQLQSQQCGRWRPCAH